MHRKTIIVDYLSDTEGYVSLIFVVLRMGFSIVILLARINARIQALLCKTENGKVKTENRRNLTRI